MTTLTKVVMAGACHPPGPRSSVDRAGSLLGEAPLRGAEEGDAAMVLHG